MEKKSRHWFLSLTILVANCPATIEIQPRFLVSSSLQAIDGYWGDWSTWGRCSQPCGISGYRIRNRLCNNPAPKNGGNPCTGADKEMMPCYTKCAVDGHWSAWSPWKLCSVTCGNGTEEYIRKCENPAPSRGGKQCPGPSTKQIPCTASPCAINGHWGSWSHWSACTVTCGTGLIHRTRYCNNPFPQHGGNSCSGPSTETQHCRQNTCPVDGHWDNWSSWGHCSVTCDDGSCSRSRSCSNPPPSHGGQACSGATKETKTCHNNPCSHCFNKLSQNNCVLIAYQGHCNDIVGFTQCPKLCRHCV